MQQKLTYDSFVFFEKLNVCLSSHLSGHALEQAHIWALSHIFRRPIIVYSVKYVKSYSGENIGFTHFEGVYLPLIWEPSFCFKNPITLGYTRGHFTALVPFEKSEILAYFSSPTSSSPTPPPPPPSSSSSSSNVNVNVNETLNVHHASAHSLHTSSESMSLHKTDGVALAGALSSPLSGVVGASSKGDLFGSNSGDTATPHTVHEEHEDETTKSSTAAAGIALHTNTSLKHSNTNINVNANNNAELLGAVSYSNEHDSQQVFYLPLTNNEGQLLPVHFLNASEVCLHSHLHRVNFLFLLLILYELSVGQRASYSQAVS